MINPSIDPTVAIGLWVLAMIRSRRYPAKKDIAVLEITILDVATPDNGAYAR